MFFKPNFLDFLTSCWGSSDCEIRMQFLGKADKAALCIDVLQNSQISACQWPNDQ